MTRKSRRVALKRWCEAAAAPDVGMVGPKLLSSTARCRRPAALLNRDGTGSLIGFGFDPRVPRYNYATRRARLRGGVSRPADLV